MKQWLTEMWAICFYAGYHRASKLKGAEIGPCFYNTDPFGEMIDRNYRTTIGLY
jgi:hypothetical protein